MLGDMILLNLTLHCSAASGSRLLLHQVLLTTELELILVIKLDVR